MARGAGRVSLQEPALGSAGFNQQHHLPLLRVIATQWAPSARLPSTPAPPAPLHTAWCSMYLHVCLAHTGVSGFIGLLLNAQQLIHLVSYTKCFEISAHIGLILTVLAIVSIQHYNTVKEGKKYEQSHDGKKLAV